MCAASAGRSRARAAAHSGSGAPSGCPRAGARPPRSGSRPLPAGRECRSTLRAAATRPPPRTAARRRQAPGSSRSCGGGHSAASLGDLSMCVRNRCRPALGLGPLHAVRHVPRYEPAGPGPRARGTGRGCPPPAGSSTAPTTVRRSAAHATTSACVIARSGHVPPARQHPRVVCHFTPTHASWMNLVEVWFSIIERQAIHRGTFGSVRDLNAKIRAFIDGWTTAPHPFTWTRTADHDPQETRQRHQTRGTSPGGRLSRRRRRGNGRAARHDRV